MIHKISIIKYNVKIVIIMSYIKQENKGKKVTLQISLFTKTSKLLQIRMKIVPDADSSVAKATLTRLCLT